MKDEALNFCKQQNLKKELKKINAIIDNGKFHEYPTIENIIQKALQVGLPVEESTDIFDDIDSALDGTNRETLPTGISDKFVFAVYHFSYFFCNKNTLEWSSRITIFKRSL